MGIDNTHSLALFACTLGCIFSGCGGGDDSDSENLSAIIATFEGINALDKKSDQGWTVRWSLLDKEGLLYGVYKAAEGEEFNFESPISTTTKDSFDYIPQNIFAEGSQCFAVRVFNIEGDENTASMCTEVEEFSFAGLTGYERQSDGGYTLEWNRIPVEGVVYAIYEKTDSTQYNFDQPSYDAIKENFVKIPVTPRGETWCYIVRYSHIDLPEDANTTEVCTEKEEEFDFEGINNVTATSSTDADVSWPAAVSKFVTSYRVYQGSDFKELMGTVEKTQTSLSISGLVPGRQYSFGVRALDEYGREDTNLKIRSIVMPGE